MTPPNTAVIPVPKLEDDFYNWYQRHAEILKLQAELNPEIVLIGDSITHLWGGPPGTYVHGVPGGVAADVWEAAFGDRVVLNLGFGWDRTQNVLWRLDNGELDGPKPKTIVLLIGTNNLTGTSNARENTPAEIRDGILAILDRLRTKTPSSRVTVMGVLPRGFEPDTPMRRNIAELNRLTGESLSQVDGVSFLEIGDRFLSPDGTLPTSMMPDGTHLSDAAYRVWGRALRESGI